jgi:hypothetical protein
LPKSNAISPQQRDLMELRCAISFASQAGAWCDLSLHELRKQSACFGFWSSSILELRDSFGLVKRAVLGDDRSAHWTLPPSRDAGKQMPSSH